MFTIIVTVLDVVYKSFRNTVHVCIYGHVIKDICCLNEWAENETRLSSEGSIGSFVITQSVLTLVGTSVENNTYS